MSWGPGTATSWSAYDDAMPQSRGSDLPAATATFAALRAIRDARPSDLEALAEVIVVVASSRGGSTLVGELLRRTPGLLSLRAEINPLFVVAGLEPPDGARRRAALAVELAAEIGRPAATLGSEEVASFGAALAWRLTAQWPGAGIDPAAVRRWVERAAQLLPAVGTAPMTEMAARLRYEDRSGWT